MPGPGRLLVLALLLRLSLLAAAYAISGKPATFETADSREYFTLARSLLFEGRFEGAAGPELHRTPGYPLFLAGCLISGHPYAAALVLQALLGCATSWLVYRLVLDLGGDESASLRCGLLCAVEPVQLAWGARIMPEALLTLLVTLCAFAFLKDLRAPALRWLVATASAAAAAAYVKPIAVFLPLAIGGLAVALSASALGRRRALGRAALLVGVAAALLAPWVVRNALVADYPGFSTKLDRVIAFRAPSLIATATEGRSFEETRRELWQRYERGRPFEAEALAAARRRGLLALLEKPGPFVFGHVRGMLRTLIYPGAMPFLELLGHDVLEASSRVFADSSVFPVDAVRRADPLVLWTASLLLPLQLAYVVLAAMAFAGKKNQPESRLALAGLVLYFLLLSGGPWGQSRFRHPIMPLLCALAGWSIPPVGGRRASAPIGP